MWKNSVCYNLWNGSYGYCDLMFIYLDCINIAFRHAVCEERKVSSERADRMRVELENMEIRLEEERKRSAELLMQVTAVICSYTTVTLI